MPTGQELVDWLMQLRGKPYIFGTEQDGKPVDKIPAEDCSEALQNACDQLGVVPKMPDGARYQQVHCRQHGLEISLEDAWTTPGAIIFMGDPAYHVAVTRGVRGRADKGLVKGYGPMDDKEHPLTIEARGKKWGIGCWEADRGGFNQEAFLAPGFDYGPDWVTE